MKIKKLLLGSGFVFGLALSLMSLSMANSASKGVKEVSASGIGLENVFIGEVSFEDGGSNPYYKNGDEDEFTGNSTDYNAFWDDSNKKLVLNDYNGPRIGCYTDGSFTIEVTGDNLITESGTGQRAGLNATDKLAVIGDGKLKIDMTGVTVSSAYGLYGFNGIKVSDSVNLEIDIEAHKIGDNYQNSCYGMYIDNGEIIIETDGTVDINMSGDSGWENFAIYNKANKASATNNGDISFTGAGKVTLNRTGSVYAEGIVSKFDNTNNLDGVFTFSGSGVEVEINDFAYSISNNSKSRDPDDYDILFEDGAKVTIDTSYNDFGFGVYSNRNGIKVDGADLVVTSNDKPVWAPNGKFGFDVIGQSHVSLVVRQETGRVLISSASASLFDLSGNGYVEYKTIDDKVPNNPGNLYIKLGDNTRMMNPERFPYNSSNDQGATSYSCWSGMWEGAGRRWEAYVRLPASNVSVNDGKTFSNTNLYYKNGESETTDDPSGYNAKYDPSTSTLYLKGYEGSTIYAESTSGGTLRIVIEADSYITASTYGIEYRNNYFGGTLEITAAESWKKLSISVSTTQNDKYIYGIKTGSGILRVCGFAELEMRVTTSDDANRTAYCIAAGANGGATITVEDNAFLDLKLNSNVSSSMPVYVQGNFRFNTNADPYEQRVSIIDGSGVEGSSSAAIYIGGSLRLNRYGTIQVKWSGTGYPIYKSSYVDEITNGAVNKDNTNKILTIKYGTPYHVDVVNGQLNSNQPAQGNYVKDQQATFKAYTIDGVSFKEWTNSGSGILSNAAVANNGVLTVKSNDTVTATYDFVTRQPLWDTRDQTNLGNLNFELKGSPTDVYIVQEDKVTSQYDSAANVDMDTVFNPSNLPAGTYYLCAEYTSSGGTVSLLSDPFVVEYNIPGLDYNVTYKAGDGTGTDVVVSTHGSISLKNFSETGFVAPYGKQFDQWNREISSVRYDEGASFTVIQEEVFTAKYKNLPVATVSFAHDEHATGSMANDSSYQTYTYTLPDPTFTPNDHYHFKAWLVDSVERAVGYQFTLTGNVTVTAIYEEDAKTTVSFDAGEGTGTIADHIDYTGETYALPDSTGFTAPENFEFNHWEINGESYNEGANLVLENASYTATAIYSRIQRTVTFSAGEGSGSMDPVQHGQGLSYTLPASTFTAPAGKEFDYWLVGETHYAPGASVEISGDITVTAVYKDLPVTPEEPVTPEAKGGLSGGAIAGIVIGSVVVLGLGGFSVVWFVIKKKSFADFLGIFKKK